MPNFPTINPPIIVAIPNVIYGRRDGDGHLTCPLTGEKQRSRGLWQISDCWNADVSDEVAYDPIKATDWAMPRLKEKPQIWSTYKLWSK